MFSFFFCKQKVLPVALVLLLGGQGYADSVQSQSQGSGPSGGSPSSVASAISASASGASQSSPIARSDTGVKSSVGSPYYTNDLATFVAQAAAAAAASAPSKPDARLSSGSINGASPSASSSGSSMGGIPYQALIQALASSAGVGPSSSQSQPSSVSSTPTSSWASPSSWINSGSGLWSMFSKPSNLVNGQRRSSLTSRLRNFMNALFYR